MRNQPAAPKVEPLERRQLLAAPTVTVMTQNVYYGGGSGAEAFATAVTDMWDNVQASRIPERAAAIAAQIKSKRPDLVALQEAVIWRTGSVLGGSADDVRYDFVAEILKHLRNRRWRYVVVSKVTNADWEFPAEVDGSIRDLRMTDQDVILARVATGSQLRILSAAHRNYRDRVSFEIPVLNEEIDFTRGWASVDAQITATGQRFRLINTHLEVLDQDVQESQARELLAGPVRHTKLPILLAGDFNSDANARQTTYRLLEDAGFRDVWRQLRPTDPGPTASQDDDLRNQNSKLTFRIDYVLYRGKRLAPRVADRVNEEQDDKTPSGLWPSDHAGVFAGIRYGLPKGGVSASVDDVLVGQASVRAGTFQTKRKTLFEPSA
jgi:endonuclease/exonuclease/phosphatase family metal-dependent hydrolase